MDPYIPMIKTINFMREISDEEGEILRNYFVHEKLKQGEFLSDYDKINKKVAFVSTGYCRVYVIDLEGNEVTIHMAGNGDFVGAISSFLTQTPSEEYVQASTDVDLLTVSYDKLNELYSLSATWEHVGRKIMEGLFLKKQKRVISFIKHSAEKRYQFLMETQPEMVLNVPMQHIASYLGIKPETLSRIRAKIT